MGKLRVELKIKPLLSEKEYENYKTVIQEALEVSPSHHIYWDLEPGENARRVRKAFLYVANREGYDLRIRAKRGARTLSIKFGDKSKSTGRMSAEESKNRILTTLATAEVPLPKSSIILATGVSPSTWNVRIKELLAAGQVEKEGSGRRTRYRLPR